MKEYVAGFLFNTNLDKVVLIRKNKPKWQQGKWNGVGGSIDPGERPLAAMNREFREETGIVCLGWERFCNLVTHDKKTSIDFFYAVETMAVLFQAKSMTDEIVQIHEIENLPVNCITNIHWLIQMALSMKTETADGFLIQELPKP